MRMLELVRDIALRRSSTPPSRPPRVGLALSGGAVRGMAHLGVLEVLQAHMPIARLAGSSAGALVAAAWAAGRSIDEILIKARTFKPLRPWRARFWDVGLLDPDYFKRHWYPLLPETFEELEIPTAIAVTDMQTGEPRLFTSGPLREVVLASCALPPLYGAVAIEGRYYLDGGLAMNLPVTGVMGVCDVIIASEVNPRRTPAPNCHATTLGLLNRALETVFKAASTAHTSLADVVIEPPALQGIFLLDDSKVDEAVAIGRAEAKAALERPEVRALLEPAFHPGVAIRPTPAPERLPA